MNYSISEKKKQEKNKSTLQTRVDFFVAFRPRYKRRINRLLCVIVNGFEFVKYFLRRSFGTKADNDNAQKTDEEA